MVKSTGSLVQQNQGAATDAELAKDVLKVLLDRVFHDAEAAADFLIGESLAKEFDDLILPLGQGVLAFAAGQVLVGRSFALVVTLKHFGNGATQQRAGQPNLASIDGTNRLYECVRRTMREQQAVELIAQDLLGQAVSDLICQQKHADIGQSLADHPTLTRIKLVEQLLVKKEQLGPLLFKVRQEKCRVIDPV